MPSGITPATISIERKLPNSSTSTARMPNTATSTAVPMPPKRFLLGLEFAARANRVTRRQLESAPGCAARRRVTSATFAIRRRVRRDDDLAQAVVPADRARRRRRTRSRSAAAAARARRSPRPPRCKSSACSVCRPCHRQPQRDVVLVAVRLAELADVQAGDRRAHGAVDLHRRHAEQRCLVGVDVAGRGRCADDAPGCRRRACRASPR